MTLGGGTLKFDLDSSLSDAITVTNGLSGSGTHITLGAIGGILSLTNSYTLLTANGGGVSHTNFTLDTTSLTVGEVPYTLSLTSDSTHLYVNASSNNSTLTLPTLPGSGELTLNIHVGDTTTVANTTVTNGGTSASHFTVTGTGSHGLVLTPIGSTSIAGGPDATSPVTARWSNVDATGAREAIINLKNDDNQSDSATPKSLIISGGVYNLAAADAGQTVDVGTFRVGTGKTTAVTLANTAPADATYTETLQTNGFSDTSAGFTASGSVSGIAGGDSGSGTLLVGVDTTAAAGPQSGATTLALQSNEVNASGLSTTGIAAQTITITGTGYNPATTDFSTTTVTLEPIHVGQSFTAKSLTIANKLSSGTYNETLGAQFANASAGVAASGGPISVAAGADPDSTMTVNLTTATTGLNTGTVDVQFESQAVNGSGLAALALGAQPITVSGMVTTGNAKWASSLGNLWSGNANWQDTTDGSVQVAPGRFGDYANTDSATFDGTGTVTTVSLAGANPSLKALNFSGAAYTLTGGTLTLAADTGTPTITVSDSTTQEIASTIVGVQGLVKDGLGTLTLTGTGNDYGGTTVTGGTLVIGSAGALPAGRSLSIGSGGTLILGGGMAMGTAAEPVPEPCTLALLAIAGLAGAMIWRKRR